MQLAVGVEQFPQLSILAPPPHVPLQSCTQSVFPVFPPTHKLQLSK